MRISCLSQESPSTFNGITTFPRKFFDKVIEKSSKLESMLDRQTERCLQRLLRRERKLKKQLQCRDSAATAELFGEIESRYASPVEFTTKTAQYLPYLDTLKTSLSFLGANSEILYSLKDKKEKIQGSLNQVKSLESKLLEAEQVKAFIRQRREAEQPVSKIHESTF